MIPNADLRSTPAVGADVGTTLVKLASRGADGQLRLRLHPSREIERAAREVESLGPARLGVTGGGAPQLERLLEVDTVRVDEFAAWSAGARALLARQGEAPGERDLLVSVGTGTSALLAEPGGARRVGGTALGGGTLLGLASRLLGTADFEEVLALAARGDRRRVDLLIDDVDPDARIPLPRGINASSFAKLARGGGDEAAPADLAHALLGLLGENIGLVCGGLAQASGAARLVYGGATLRGNPALREILAVLAAAAGRAVVFLEDGEFAGALGALEIAAARAEE